MSDFNRTKIVATIGPASSSKEVLKKMILAGVNVCRLNFSHGSHDDHRHVIKTIKEINKELWVHTAILCDLQGPKIRIGEVENNEITLTPGTDVIFTTKKCIGTSDRLYINYENFPKDVRPSEFILIEDGRYKLRVIDTNYKDEVRATVIIGGNISSKKGVNLPNTKVSLPCLTEKDRADLEFALEHNVEWIGLSFVRSAADIIELNHIIKSRNKNSKVVAKIEKPEAIEDIDDIIKETGALMVARGDLGVEIPMEEVPMVQKMLIRKSLENSKPIIVATQMMESMIYNATPTRAEVNDVANSVMDGADAVMFSGETSLGKYPLEVVEVASRIINTVENSYADIFYRDRLPELDDSDRFVTDSICFNASRLAARISAKALITMTHSGYTAIKLSSYRPKAHVFVFTSNHSLLNQLSLVWGVRGFYYDKTVSTDHTIADIMHTLKKEKLIVKNDYVVNIASMPIQEMGKANMLKLSKVE